jgi:hypothetical protein
MLSVGLKGALARRGSMGRWPSHTRSTDTEGAKKRREGVNPSRSSGRESKSLVNPENVTM